MAVRNLIHNKGGMIVAVASYMIVSSLVLNLALTYGKFHNQERHRLSRMVYREADRPFVCRALVPFVVYTLTSATPSAIRAKIEHVMSSRGSFACAPIEEGRATEFVWTMLVIYISLIGFATTMRWLIITIYHPPDIVAAVAPLLALACLPLAECFFMYDYAGLFLFTFCIGAIVAGKWRLYYPAFVASCFNKETAILLPLIIILNRHDPGIARSWWKHVSVQVIIWLLIITILRFIFRHNGGVDAEFHLFDYNIPFLTNPLNFLKFSYVILPRGLNLFILVPMAYMILKDWYSKPIFLRRSLLIAVPLVLLAFLMGYLDETRIYFEVLPIWFLLALYTYLRMFSVPIQVEPQIADA